MVFVAAPESAAGVSLSEAWEVFEHFLGGVRFQHDLCNLNGVPLWYIDQEVDMVKGKAEVAELKPEAFEVMERLGADVNVDLFSKTVVSVVGDEHHGHPVIASVTRNLFRATANYIFHNNFFSCRTFRGQAKACRTRQKRVSFDYLRKKRCDFSSAGLTLMLQTARYSQSQLINRSKTHPYHSWY
jgi:hypothetical protein